MVMLFTRKYRKMRNLRIKIMSCCGYIEFEVLAVYLGVDVWETLFQSKNHGLRRDVKMQVQEPQQ